MAGLDVVSDYLMECDWLTLVFFLIIFWCTFEYSKWIYKRRQIYRFASLLPGPRTLPLFGNALTFAFNPEIVLDKYAAFNKKYNRKMFRIWLGFSLSIILSKPEDIEPILGNKKQVTKSNQYDLFRPIVGEGLFTNNNTYHWKLHRKLVTPAFHFSILKGFLTIFHQETTILASKLDKTVGKPVDVKEYIGLCALDSICRTAMGVTVNAQNGRDGEFVHNMETIFKIWQNMMTKPWYMIPIIFKMTSLKRKHDKVVSAILSFTENVIKKKKQQWENNKEEYQSKLEKGEKVAFLDLMLGSGMTDQELRDETMTIITTGQETTTTELCFALLMLSMHKYVQEKVQDELYTIFGNDKYTAPTLNDLNKLEYTERVIKEVMRLYPAGPLIARHLEDDQQIGDYLVPKGTDVFIFIMQTHRDPEHWEDPDTFDPDRFLPENCKSRHPYSYIPFSAGLRNCIGQKYGLLQMKTVLSTLLRRFNLKPSPEFENPREIETIMTITLSSKMPGNVIFEHR